MTTGSDRGTAAIVLHSGSYDRASYALTLALVALSMGMDARMLLTHGGLRRFSGDGLEEMGDDTPGQLRKDFEMALMTGAVNSIEKQLADAKELGLRLYACTGAMAIADIRQEHLRPEVDETIGLGVFLEIARSAAINWYI
jgi:peroxiredoxin family protein